MARNLKYENIYTTEKKEFKIKANIKL